MKRATTILRTRRRKKTLNLFFLYQIAVSRLETEKKNSKVLFSSLLPNMSFKASVGGN